MASIEDGSGKEVKVAPEAINKFIGSCEGVVGKLATECNALVEIQGKYTELLGLPNDGSKQRPLVAETHVEAFLEKLTNRMLLIPVIGTGSSGKTTLLDSILGENFLPYSVKRDTVIRVYIQHDYTRHVGRCKEPECPKCPELYIGLGTKDKSPVARGVQAIHDKVVEYNELTTQDGEEAPKCLHLLANIPCIRAKSTELPLTPYLADCEALEYLGKDTKEHMKVVTATIVVHSYEQFLQNQESVLELLRLVHYSEAEILVAVTHFDAFYDEDSASAKDRNPTAEETKHHLAKVGGQAANIKPENVFPICSRWALTGRIANQSGGTRKQIAFLQYAMSLYSAKLGIDNNNWAPEVAIEASGIEDMENRIQRLIRDADHSSWCHSILEDLQALLVRPIESAKLSVIKLEAKVEEEQKKLHKRWEAKNKVEENRRTLADKCGEATKQHYSGQLKSALVLPEDHAIQTVVDDSIEQFFKEWEQKTEGGHDEVQSQSVLEFLIGIEELLQIGIPEAMKGLDYNATGLAETALASAIQELDEVYAMCCCSVSELAGDQARVIHMPGVPSQNFSSQVKPVPPIPMSAGQHKELLQLFKEAVEDKKHSIPFMIGAAISMVSIVTIPWAVRRFKERRLQNKLETSLEKETSDESVPFEQMFTGKEEEVLKECKPSSEEVRMMERKVRDITCQSEYKRKLVEGYREVTMDCLMEPFAEAVQQRANTLLHKLDEQLESTIITVVHDLGKEQEALNRIDEDKVAIQHIIHQLEEMADNVNKDYPF